jgi:general secretion pathway protein E
MTENNTNKIETQGNGVTAPEAALALLAARYPYLLKAGVPVADLTEAVREFRGNGASLFDILIQKKYITERALLHALGDHFHLPFLPELPTDHMNTDFTDRIPIQYLKKNRMVPLDTPQGAFIAVNDPSNFQALDDLRNLLELQDFQTVLASQAAIQAAINLAYDISRNTAKEFFEEMNGSESPDSIISEIEDTGDLLDETSDAPIIKLVNLLLSGAIKDRASDIHIEPYQGTLKIRYRIDGILYDILSLPRRIQSPLTSRVKIMARLNIAEKRLPQDGRIDVKIGNQEIDIRVSTIPTSFGERVVLRLLNKSSSLIGLPELGLSPERLAVLEKLVSAPNGIVLVTGPTGSGKTTTLYAVLSSLNKPDINIITIEDPVEYQIKGISQIQVNPKIDLTFAKGLRSIVRQDPDIILVGEIRDRETAEIAVQSALTGHRVFSTLHTNDAASAITRLVDIDVEPFLIASSVLGVVAQRLIRTLCQFCKEPYTPDDFAIESLGLTPDQAKDAVFYRPKGCPECVHTGYKGRIGIFEIMVMESNLKSLILRNFDANRIKQEALKNKMVTLRDDGLEKIFKGITSMEEVIRVTHL